MRRLILNASSCGVVLIATFVGSAAGFDADDECRTSDGGFCSGEICCVYKNMCTTDPDLCRELLCIENPSLPDCGPD